MNLKTIFATGALALLPLAAQAEMAPMADAELRAVQGQGPILDATLSVIERLADLEELDEFDVIIPILRQLDELIDPDELDLEIDLGLLPMLFSDSVEAQREALAGLYQFRAELNEGVGDLLPRGVAGFLIERRLDRRASRFELFSDLIMPETAVSPI